MLKLLALLLITLPISSSFAKEKIIIPIEIKDKIPYIQMKINNKTIPFVLDSGAKTSLHLTPEVAQYIDGLRYTGRTKKSMDLAGIMRESKEFTVPELNFDGMKFSNLTGVILSPWGIYIGGAQGPDPNISVIGMDFFKKKKIIIDFPSNTLTMYEGDKDISNNMDDWIRLPFEISDEGYVLTITDGKKEYRMILDTASTVSMMKSSSMGKDTIIEKCEDYGTEKICRTRLSFLENYFLEPLVLNLANEFHADGIVGNDFFSCFSVLLDLKNKAFYVKPHKV
ncbi:MAG: retropepsin-like aspartic protease [Comamonas sp.]